MKVGTCAESVVHVTCELIDKFADFSGDSNPLHLDKDFARGRGFKDRLAHGALSVLCISRLIGMRVPGPGALWVSHHLEWLLPVYPGDTLYTKVEVVAFSEATGVATLSLIVTNQDTKKVMSGKGKVLMTEQIGQPLRTSLPPVAIITGANAGIGAEIALVLARNGAKIVVNYLSNKEQALTVCEEIQSHGGESIAVQADIKDLAAVQRMFDETERVFGVVSILVNNATANYPVRNFIELSWEDFTSYLEVNLRGAVNCTQVAVKCLRANDAPGSVINIGSSVSFGVPPENSSIYVTAKSALAGLTRSLAVEYGRYGIRVNLISPGFVGTGLSGAIEPRMKKVLAMQNPLRRLCSAKDIAEAVRYLALQDCYMNGGNIVLTGGEQML